MNLTIDFWIRRKKYWNLVECKGKDLRRFNVYCNFVHSLLNIIRRLNLASSLPSQWDRCQSCKYTLGTTFGIISQNFLIARHKYFGRAAIAHLNIKQFYGVRLPHVWHFIHGQACNAWNLFKNITKDMRRMSITSFRCFYYSLRTEFKHTAVMFLLLTLKIRFKMAAASTIFNEENMKVIQNIFKEEFEKQERNIENLISANFKNNCGGN